MHYPDDANGDALRRMENSGDDMTLPRNIDFTVVFPNEHAAQKFAQQLRDLGYVTSVVCAQAVEDLPWDVRLFKGMVPTYEGIVEFEEFLEDQAAQFGGRNDGWGCLSEPPPS